MRDNAQQRKWLRRESQAFYVQSHARAQIYDRTGAVVLVAPATSPSPSAASGDGIGACDSALPRSLRPHRRGRLLVAARQVPPLHTADTSGILNAHPGRLSENPGARLCRPRPVAAGLDYRGVKELAARCGWSSTQPRSFSDRLQADNKSVLLHPAKRRGFKLRPPLNQQPA